MDFGLLALRRQVGDALPAGGHHPLDVVRHPLPVVELTSRGLAPLWAPPPRPRPTPPPVCVVPPQLRDRAALHAAHRLDLGHCPDGESHPPLSSDARTLDPLSPLSYPPLSSPPLSYPPLSSPPLSYPPLSSPPLSSPPRAAPDPRGPVPHTAARRAQALYLDFFYTYMKSKRERGIDAPIEIDSV